jgi:hypothetical protein
VLHGVGDQLACQKDCRLDGFIRLVGPAFVLHEGPRLTDTRQLRRKLRFAMFGQFALSIVSLRICPDQPISNQGGGRRPLGRSDEDAFVQVAVRPMISMTFSSSTVNRGRSGCQMITPPSPPAPISPS